MKLFKTKKSFIMFLIMILTICTNSVLYASFYDQPKSYTYDFYEEAVPGPKAYTVREVITDTSLDVGEFDSPQDLFISDNEIYIVDTGNNRIVIFDKEWNLIKEIKEFKNQGEQDTFNNPTGIFVNEEGKIYVADKDNRRIVLFDQDRNFIKELKSPVSKSGSILSNDFIFKPTKVIVDRAERIYVVAAGVYDGLMELNEDGVFKGFIGAPRVNPNIADYIWRTISTKKQKDRMTLFLPTEYSNFDIDKKGFIYATVAGGDVRKDEVVKRLNPSGEDVLRRNGFHPPVGDIDYPEPELNIGISFVGKSVFTDISSGRYGLYNVLDQKRGRIFTYDKNGNLLYAFGGIGNKEELFKIPTAIENLDGDLLVLDSAIGEIKIFKPTEYTSFVRNAKSYYQNGKYDKSAQMWREALKRNANFSLAYSGIGRSLLRKSEYKKAMTTYKLGNDRPGYSKALKKYRRQYISNNFATIMTMILIIILFIYFINKFHLIQKSNEQICKNIKVLREGKPLNKVLKALYYSLYVIIHPFDGFWKLKHEKKGNVVSATILVIAVILTNIFRKQYTGFIFNTVNLEKFNIYMEFVGFLIPFLLWCTVNWAATTLLQGKGTFKDIYNYTAYALTPFIIINVPMTIISNVITMEEGAFYFFFTVLSILWTGLLIFFGTQVTHNFSIKKTFFVNILIIIGMGIVVFIALLFFSILAQVSQFIKSVYSEIMFRI